MRACSATDTMYHVLVHSQKSHMRDCPFRFNVTVNYKLFTSSTFLPLAAYTHMTCLNNSRTHTNGLSKATAPKRRRVLAAVISTVVASAGYVSLWRRIHPDPYHMSRLSGSGWVFELLNGHPDHMSHNLAVSARVFCRLERELVQKGGLMSRRWITTTEQLAIFLYQIATGR